ncbi:ABC transporter substrate-binding protein [Jeotgalibacillus haloalkalitolerans]|uniref:ABC transporter substrate-binding protein n=1 Tax=Jeotgalibacillus haloalkalitolerans TaxID=3104292 RepID=A0ABU5KJJ1_9BACL|nr:ABC transporter substrate-binding protein [Jeotgalibacillus sp. HH7-29]MDZ5711432.1 ABC transporter substrate-binding protein [Jeotgalibacillus sp. HH7-29]
MKKVWLSGAALSAAMVLAACGEETSETSAEGGGEDSYTIGVTQIVEHPSLDAATEGFKRAFEEAGLEVTFDDQVAQGDQNNSQSISQKFVADGVDLIFANSTPSALSSLNATADIPIVFTSVTDPLAANLVADMEAPGGNVTGTTDMHPDAISNTVEFMTNELVVKSIGMVYNAGEPNSVVQVDAVKEAVGSDVTVEEAAVSTSADVKQAAESLVGKVDAFYIITDNTVVSALESVIGVANDQDIPLFVGELDSVARGGFAAYGFEYGDIGYEAGQMAVEILTEGADPGEMAVQYPGNLKLMINKDAAEEMGIDIKPEWEEMAEFTE